jgi:hypothetical protein
MKRSPRRAKESNTDDALLQKRRAEWQAVAEYFSEVITNPDAPEPLRNALFEMIDETLNNAGVSITDPEILRIVYPLACERLLMRSDG